MVVGDALGDLVVAPVVLTWRSFGGLTLSARRILEGLALVVTAVALSCFVFLLGPPLDPTPFRQAHILFPVLIWAAVRFGPRGGTATILLVSVFAIWGSLVGHGPFVGDTPDLSLLKLQIFMAVASITALVLAAASTERVEALKAEQELLAIVSHDLKNPLGALRLGARQLLRHPGGARSSGPQARRVHRPVCPANGIPDGQLAGCGHDPDRPPVPLSRAAGPERAHPGRRRYLPPAGGGEVTVAHGGGAATAAGGRRLGAVLQVLSNLLGNAVKFAPAEGTITVRASVADGWVQCSISDDGPGIGPDELHRVFEPYWSKESSKGPAWGCRLSRASSRRMAGRRRPERAGEGTTIGFRLPLVSGEAAAPGRWFRACCRAGPGPASRRAGLQSGDHPADRPRPLQRAVRPPSTVRIWPTTKLASGEAR